MVNPGQVVVQPKPQRKPKPEKPKPEIHPAYRGDIESLVSRLSPLLTIEETADALGVSRAHVKSAIKSGRLRAHKLSPARQGAVRVTSTAVGDYLAERIA